MKTEKGAATTGKPMDPKKTMGEKQTKETTKPGVKTKPRPAAK